MVKEKQYRSNSLLRGLKILEAFGASRPQMTLSQIADEISVTSSAAYRFVQTLEAEGYLERDPASRTFRLAPRAMQLGYSYIKSLDVGEIAGRHAMLLRDETGFSVHVSVLEGTEVVYIYRAMSQNAMVSNISVGTRLPAFATSMGRLLLSNLEDEKLDELFKTYEFQKFTDETVGSFSELKLALSQDKKRGYVAQKSQLASGTMAIAAPLIEPTGRYVGAINVSGHQSQLTLDDNLIGRVKICAEQISNLL
jgi:IclR family pca regulon transcriptional regulator